MWHTPDGKPLGHVVYGQGGADRIPEPAAAGKRDANAHPLGERVERPLRARVNTHRENHIFNAHT